MNKNRISLPRAGEWLIKRLISEEDLPFFMGDIQEVFVDKKKEMGWFLARFWLWFQLLKTFPPILLEQIKWRLNMIKNYLKIAIRNLFKYKGYSFINISGLALGMACCILIFLWVRDELSYDRFHKNYEEVYRVLIDDQFQSTYAVTPPPLAPLLKSKYPEIVDVVRLKLEGSMILKVEDDVFSEKDFLFADQSIFDIFSFEFFKGNPQEAFSSPDSILLTKRMSKKHFGDTDPIGKTLTLNNQFDFTVTGILKNIPENSHLKFNFLINFPVLKKFGKNIEGWGNYGYNTYVRLGKGIAYQPVSSKIKGELIRPNTLERITLRLQPLKEIRLYSSSVRSWRGGGDIQLVYIFSLIGLFILIIACINFMNLTTARSSNRAREVGMRKVTGAGRGEIIKQFFGESILMSIIAVFLAIILVYLLMPFFNNLCGKQLSLGLFTQGDIFFYLAAITLFTGILSGIYPALFLSSFQPTKVLKGTVTSVSGKYWLRKVLVVTQFSLSILLIIGTIVVFNQLNFLKNKKMGFDKEHLAYIRMPVKLNNLVQPLKNNFLSHPNVIDVSAASSLPVNPLASTEGVDWEGKTPNDKMLIHFTFADYDYTKTLKLQMAQGRYFSRGFGTDATKAFVLNETAIKTMGMTSPIGKWFTMWDQKGIIIGVVKDYNFRSLHRKIDPLIIMLTPQRYSYFLLRLKSELIPETLNDLKKKWRKAAPGLPFDYGFIDDRINNLYRSEQQVGSAFFYFTLLSIIISCLGLFGLASFMAEQRKKEVGIRKILGAPIKGIVILVSKEFLKWVLLANLIAWPVAYYSLNKLLQNFAYRINIDISTFLISGLLAASIALLTVSYQSIKTALTNPIDTIKYE
jgi:ABC-type antimicrobial peptide transport system permease subunit